MEEKALEFAARFACEKEVTRFTRFLDPAQAAKADELARTYGSAFSSWGGYDHAERVIGCFHPLHENVEYTDYPLVCLHTAFASQFVSLTHRDLLGAFMALGLTRDCVGDIILEDKDIYLFSTEQTADFIVQSLTSAGKASLSFHLLEGALPAIMEKGIAFHATVSSLRLDAVAACAYRLSRAEAADTIRAGLMKVDHLPCARIDRILEEGALLSLRGRGRVRLKAVDGLTKKQRIGLTLFRYE